MGIWDRLGDVIKSYLNDDDEKLFGRNSRRRSGSADPDLNEAFDELNDFLDRDKAGGAGVGGESGTGGNAGVGGSDAFGRGSASGGTWGRDRQDPGKPPEELRSDFAELGLGFGASAEECKSAYKKLLKIHHPDRHAGHEGNFRKATEKSARINAAYDRIENWRKNALSK
jgi:curved DNA-binding protein CbpA